MAGVAEGLGREIVLGLLVEAPGNAYQVDQRVGRRFGSHRYAQGMARQALERLHHLGYAQPIAPRPHGAVAGAREKTVWEATPMGVARSREWVREHLSKPPIREELHAKIALCRRDDMPRLIEVVREAERLCVAELQRANAQTRARRLAGAGDDWARSMDLIVSAGELAWWDSRIKWLQSVRVYLDRELRHPAS